MIFVIFLLSFFIQLSAATAHILRIQCPQGWKHIPGMRAYYKGERLDLSDHWCIVPETTRTAIFSLIVTDEIGFATRDANVRSLQRTHDHCRWFDLTLSITDTGYSWQTQELSIDEMPQRIPEHAITVLIDPEFVDKLAPCTDETCEPTDDEKAAAVSATVIIFPQVVLKKNSDRKKFDDSLGIIALGALDIETVHRTPERAEKIVEVGTSCTHCSISRE